MGCSAQIGAVDEDWRSQKRLYQLSRLINHWCALLPQEGIFEEVEHWRCLLPLEKVDDPNKIVEIGKAWIHRSLMPTSAADILAFPVAAQQVDRPIRGDQRSEKERADVGDRLGQPFIERSRRRLWQLERILLLQAREDCSGNTAAGDIPVDIGVAPDLISCNEGSPKDS